MEGKVTTFCKFVYDPYIQVGYNSQLVDWKPYQTLGKFTKICYGVSFS